MLGPPACVRPAGHAPIRVELGPTFQFAAVDDSFAEQPAGVLRDAKTVFLSADQQREVKTTSEIIEVGDRNRFAAIRIGREEAIRPSPEPRSCTRSSLPTPAIQSMSRTASLREATYGMDERTGGAASPSLPEHNDPMPASTIAPTPTARTHAFMPQSSRSKRQRPPLSHHFASQLRPG